MIVTALSNERFLNKNGENTDDQLSDRFSWFSHISGITATIIYCDAL
ncbi:MAG: hypothetical protein V3U71_04495 [Cocleimonas sp.]